MNVTCIPYHDWRKIELEGSRTRDSHIIHHLAESADIDKLIIVNRPITRPELIIKKRLKKITGEVVFKYKNCTLYKINHKVYVIDTLFNDIIGPVIKKKSWFFDSFGRKELYEGYLQCLKFLSVNIDIVLTQNVFSAKFFERGNTPFVFDAWDNFLMFPENKQFEADFKAAYQSLADRASAWVTNSAKNVTFYNENYGPKSCQLIKNGVDIELFSKKYDAPDDLAKIASPIIGFGGKITHLFDYDLFNRVVKKHADKNFVIVGQILNKEVFQKIEMGPNVHYLGDKHYSQYPSYVKNFDIGIVPYVTGNLEHGVDSIKVYEYIASGLNVIGTSEGGMGDLGEYIYVAKNWEEFSSHIGPALQRKKNVQLPDFYTWRYKTECIVKLFKDIIVEQVVNN
jgi:teichuronic acid biosynthesis glycosyltransferase TuaH